MKPTMDHFYAVIMAGGGGTRLWPLSRQARPKQMLALFDNRSLFQTTVERLTGLLPAERILVVTVHDQVAELQAQCPQIPTENYLIEPMPRGTASVVGLAAIALQQIDPQAVMAVLPSDHYISNLVLFHDLVIASYATAQAGYLVTLGIEPTFAATGFGYIQMGEKVGEFGVPGTPAYRVIRFKEKPADLEAQVMLASGDHTWNSGMFAWRVDKILAEFKRQMPNLGDGLSKIDAAWRTPEMADVINKVWPGLSNQSIDYGVMEGAADVVVLPAAGLGWSDVGSWDSLFEVLQPDQDGNIIMGGEHLGINTNESLIYVNQPHRLIVTIGVDNLVVVDTGDVLMVCRKDQAQKVRQVVSKLRQSGQEYV